jgi:hypothetical protein
VLRQLSQSARNSKESKTSISALIDCFEGILRPYFHHIASAGQRLSSPMKWVMFLEDVSNILRCVGVTRFPGLDAAWHGIYTNSRFKLDHQINSSRLKTESSKKKSHPVLTEQSDSMETALVSTIAKLELFHLVTESPEDIQESMRRDLMTSLDWMVGLFGAMDPLELQRTEDYDKFDLIWRLAPLLVDIQFIPCCLEWGLLFEKLCALFQEMIHSVRSMKTSVSLSLQMLEKYSNLIHKSLMSCLKFLGQEICGNKGLSCKATSGTNFLEDRIFVVIKLLMDVMIVCVEQFSFCVNTFSVLKYFCSLFSKLLPLNVNPETNRSISVGVNSLVSNLMARLESSWSSNCSELLTGLLTLVVIVVSKFVQSSNFDLTFSISHCLMCEIDRSEDVFSQVLAPCERFILIRLIIIIVVSDKWRFESSVDGFQNSLDSFIQHKS